MSSWGDVNRVMNRLVSEGRIVAYRSNASEAGRSNPLAITIEPAPGQDPEVTRRETLRRLARLGIVAEVACGRDVSP